MNYTRETEQNEDKYCRSYFEDQYAIARVILKGSVNIAFWSDFILSPVLMIFLIWLSYDFKELGERNKKKASKGERSKKKASKRLQLMGQFSDLQDVNKSESSISKSELTPES